VTGSIELLVEIDEAGASEERLDDLTSGLRSDLLELDVEQVERPRASAPRDAKAFDVAALGALIVMLPPTTLAVADVIELVRRWVDRGGDRTVRVTIDGDTIELASPTDLERVRIVEAWMKRHAGSQ
jgi:hypothetical protein